MAAALVLESLSLSSGDLFQEENDPELVEPDEKYVCPIHKGLLQNPVQTLCGHRLCQSCVPIYLDGKESKPCPVDDEDIEPVTRDNVIPDPGFQREINNLLVCCRFKNSGCKAHVKFKELSKHVQKCTFKPVKCKYSSRGCQEPVVMCFQSEHEKDCQFQPATCKLCGQDFNLKDVKAHEEDHCPEGIIECRYKCKAKMKRREMEDHFNICPLKPDECCYKVLGCDFMGDKEAVAAHEKDIGAHFEFLVAIACDMKLEMRKVPKVDTQLCVQLKEKADLLEKNLSKMAKEFKMKNVGLVERIITLEKKFEEMKKEEDKMVQELEQIKGTLQNLKGSVLNNGADSMDAKLSKLEVRIAENDLRFQMIETANYDGNLLWKIRDFTIRRRDAVQGRTVSLYSQPFYTGRFGYKMCARVYLNGDGIGKGTHVSLYFVVMKGEYDALLPWPFQLKITLMLLDQGPNKRHLKDEFIPDPNSTSFKQPNIAEMNVASGCPLFVSHSAIDSPGSKYVQDDILFVKVSVDSHQLPKIG